MNASDDQDAGTSQASEPASLRQGPDPRVAGPPLKGRRAWAPAILAAAIVLGLWGPNLLRPPPPAWTAYISLKGQTRRIKLADKSVLWMSGASAVRVVFEDRLRRAAFDGGEAEFAIAPNARPFVMRVGDREIRTRVADFDLRRYGPVGAVGATLTVRRGQVEVGQSNDKDDPRTLGPGDQMSWIDARPAAPTRRVDPEVALAWESHRLIYDHTPLNAVVTDLNRYVDRPITIAEPSVAALPFTGVLILDSEERMLRQLQAALPVQAQALPAAILLKPRSSAPAACAKGKPCAKPPLRAAPPRQ